MVFFLIILFSLLGAIGAIMIAGIFLLLKEKTQKILIPCLISYATGTLLATALLGLIPHAIEKAPLISVLSSVLGGIVFFFLLEKLLIWRHCHNKECKVHKPAGPMILIGDALHNFTDGVVIAASFLSSISLGIVVGLSIIAHEIPQEVGDFAILLHSGYSKKRAFLVNILSGLSALLGAILAYYFLEALQGFVPYIMAISASSFLYVALADLSPQLHQKVGLGFAIRQFFLMLAGILTIVLILQFDH